MIYLKPLGGLCNRMRSIDSVIALCDKYKQELTILWVKDESLNCSFNDIFNLSKKSFTIRVVDCPVGFPEQYPSFLVSNSSYPSTKDKILRITKNNLKFRFLSKNLKLIRNDINKIEEKRRLNNDDLQNIYASSNYVENKSTREMDDLFISKLYTRIHKLFSQEKSNAYITSCYRINRIDGNYDNFHPIESIEKEIKIKTQDFSNVYGLHIRKSDHITAKLISTTDKFLNLIDDILSSEMNAKFFISTDDEITKNELIKKYGDKIIYNEINSFDRNTSIAVIGAVKDLYCLAATKQVFGSHHSSFSQTAADIGGIKEITVK